MTPKIPAHFQQNYQRLLNCLKLAGMQPKTVALYSQTPFDVTQDRLRYARCAGYSGRTTAHPIGDHAVRAECLA